MTMIAINWFEVLLPSTTFEVAFEPISETSVLPKRVKTLRYRTIYHKADQGLYHISESPPDKTKRIKVDFDKRSSIADQVIEQGFALRLLEVGFTVRLREVGGIGSRSVKGSERPHIYESLEGIAYRCFHGFDSEAPQRWGLVLSFVSSQRFVSTLSDRGLREFALHKRVVPVNSSVDREANDPPVATVHSGILDSVKDGTGVLVNRDGDQQQIQLSEWTLPCSRGNLLGFIRSIEGISSANRLATRLQQDSLALTAEGRINTNLAREQLERLQSLLSQNHLLSFSLPLPGSPPVRISTSPLFIGN